MDHTLSIQGLAEGKKSHQETRYFDNLDFQSRATANKYSRWIQENWGLSGNQLPIQTVLFSGWEVTCRLLSFQVFLKAGVISRLEKQREKLVSHSIILFQAACKGFLSRQEFKKLKVWRPACLMNPAEVWDPGKAPSVLVWGCNLVLLTLALVHKSPASYC